VGTRKKKDHRRRNEVVRLTVGGKEYTYTAEDKEKLDKWWEVKTKGLRPPSFLPISPRTDRFYDRFYGGDAVTEREDEVFNPWGAPNKAEYRTFTREMLRSEIERIWPEETPFGAGLVANARSHADTIPVYGYPSAQKLLDPDSEHDWYREYMRFNNMEYRKFDLLKLIQNV
jgi:hypothetical protein